MKALFKAIKAAWREGVREFKIQRRRQAMRSMPDPLA